MMRTCKTLVLVAALAAACPVIAAAGGTGGDADNKAIQKQLDELRKTVEALSKKIDAVSAQPNTKPLPDKAASDEILARLSAIEKSLARLQQAPGGTAQISKYPSPNGSVGRVQLINLYTEDLWFLVNERPFRVEPNRTMELDVPAGSMVYEVVSPTWGRRFFKTGVLQPNETFTLTAR